jgi:hypothetical protein
VQGAGDQGGARLVTSEHDVDHQNSNSGQNVH